MWLKRETYSISYGDFCIHMHQYYCLKSATEATNTAQDHEAKFRFQLEILGINAQNWFFQ